MANIALEERILRLEAEMEAIKNHLAVVSTSTPPIQPWWEQVAGSFADDALFEAATTLGAKYRQELKPAINKSTKS